ncbi:MAG: hypothetical protein K8Q89_09155 [Nitrosarchaeum sp.]|nr:hypothetical protein [Nitrosarchaeum sp.]
MEHCEFLNTVLKQESTIRFAGLYDENFQTIVDGAQPGILPYLSREETQNSIRYDIRRWETYKMFHAQLGDSEFAMVKYDKAILLTFSLRDAKYLRVSIEPTSDYKAIIEKIQKLIKENPKLY